MRFDGVPGMTPCRRGVPLLRIHQVLVDLLILSSRCAPAASCAAPCARWSLACRLPKDRKSVVSGMSVGLGGRRILQNKQVLVDLLTPSSRCAPPGSCAAP